MTRSSVTSPIENAVTSPIIQRADRRRVLKVGTISYEYLSTSHYCVVRDISESGAKLKFEHPVLLPKEFWLAIEIDAFRVECEIAWIRGLDMGVRFIGDKVAMPQTRKQVLSIDQVNPEDDRVNSENVEHNDCGSAEQNFPNQSVHVGRVFGKRT